MSELKYILTKEQLDAYGEWRVTYDNFECFYCGADNFSEIQVDWLKANPCPLPEPEPVKPTVPEMTEDDIEQISEMLLHDMYRKKGYDADEILKFDDEYIKKYLRLSAKEYRNWLRTQVNAANKPKLIELSSEEVRRGRPMYMNREDAIKVLKELDNKRSQEVAENDGAILLRCSFESMIDALIESGHLTNHLPEGKSSNKPSRESE